MLGSPLATSEDVIDVVSNVWTERVGYMMIKGNTDGIDIGHFEDFRGSCKLGREVPVSTEVLNIQYHL